MFYWLLKNVLLGPWLKWVFKPVAEGVENVPQEGAAILACNHLSYGDWLFMPLMLNRRVTFVAKAEYFTGTGVKGTLQRWFFTGAGQVPIDRTSADAASGALQTGLNILERGELFGIFVEGTRSPDGRLYKGKTGVARLALAADVPVIPIGIVGTDEIAPTGKVVARIVRPTVRFGKAMDFSRYEGMDNDRFVLRSITDEIVYGIMLLTGQEYVDVYAAKLKTKVSTVARSIGEGAAAVATNINEKIHAVRTDETPEHDQLSGEEIWIQPVAAATEG